MSGLNALGLRLRGAVKRFGDAEVIHGVDLEVEDGAFCVFVGPSGCGKSTLLRMIAGLEVTTAGAIAIAGRDVTRVDAAERGVAMVFQSYALYPHMTVAQNMGFGLRMGGHPKAQIAERVARAADILKLGPLLDRKPGQLSGGQRQRVAIGRAIVRDPRVFLFDEPLSNLDAELRVEMRVELSRLHQRLGATMIYVTHDQVEAMTLADKIVVLRDGRIEQAGAPLELYDNPANRFVAGFIGSPAMNFLDGRAQGGRVALPGGLSLTLASAAAPPDGAAVTVGARPEHLGLTDGDAFRVDVIEHLGGVSYLHLEAQDGARVVAEARDARALRPGARLGLTLDPARALLFDPATGARLGAAQPQS